MTEEQIKEEKEPEVATDSDGYSYQIITGNVFDIVSKPGKTEKTKDDPFIFLVHTDDQAKIHYGVCYTMETIQKIMFNLLMEQAQDDPQKLCGTIGELTTKLNELSSMMTEIHTNKDK